ncbi:MAG: hypothetical protein ACFFFO_14855, partial [Candidatus Thorarchaeota archaeon]
MQSIRRFVDLKKVVGERKILSQVEYRYYICFSCLYGRKSGPNISRAMTTYRDAIMTKNLILNRVF